MTRRLALLLLLLLLRFAELLKLGERGLRLRRAFELGIDATELVVGFGEIRVEFDNLFKLADRFHQTIGAKI